MSDSSNAACPSVTVVILDADGCRIAEGIEDLTAIVLWATLSDDPATWGELLDCFPRYQVPAVTEFPDSLPFRACSADDVLAAIGADTCWMALDLTSCRAFCGPGLEPPEQNVILAAECGPNGEQKSPLPIHLPPWWEQHESASAAIVFERRTTLIEIPMTNREFLYGDALISELAFSILRAIAAGRLAGHAAEGSSIRQVLYRLSVEIHRDWLMTSREELNGGKPRDLLHGAHRWSDSVVHGQQVRADSGFPVVAAPKDGRRYANAPMGREEMIVYFDLCRELLDAGWEWSLSEEITEAQIAAPQEIAAIRSRLNRFLAARRDDWLESPFEGGSAPRFII
ncbi:MAG: hypothetical protein KDA96_22295, partial [Planctomycetaceae bacterium]|nr:hypothetical protein [Planctomycetaceae bacterium]